MIKSLLAQLSLLEVKGSTYNERLTLEASKDTWNLYVGKTAICGGLLDKKKNLPVVEIEMTEIDTSRAPAQDELWKMIEIDSYKKNK